MLTDAQLTDVRRHMGVPVAGIPNSNFTMGIRAYDPELPYYQQVGLLEFRLANLTPGEESVLTGAPLGQIVLGGVPTTGATITVTAASTQLASYEATADALAANEPLYAIAQGIVNAINAANAPNGGNWVAATGPHSPGSPVFTPQAAFTLRSITTTPFSLSVQTSNDLSAVVAVQGTLPSPSATLRGNVTLYGLLPILNYLEGIIANASDYAAFRVADVVTFDRAELAKRAAVYGYWRRRLARFIGIRLNPTGPRSGNGVIV